MGDEHRGRCLTAPGSVPARQRLDPDQPAALEGDQRLVVGLHLAVVDGRQDLGQREIVGTSRSSGLTPRPSWASRPGMRTASRSWRSWRSAMPCSLPCRFDRARRMRDRAAFPIEADRAPSFVTEPTRMLEEVRSGAPTIAVVAAAKRSGEVGVSSGDMVSGSVDVADEQPVAAGSIGAAEGRRGRSASSMVPGFAMGKVTRSPVGEAGKVRGRDPLGDRGDGSHLTKDHRAIATEQPRGARGRWRRTCRC